MSEEDLTFIIIFIIILCIMLYVVYSFAMKVFQ